MKSNQSLLQLQYLKSKVDESLKNSLHSLLQHESPYAEILEELNGGTKQVARNSLIFKRMRRII